MTAPRLTARTRRFIIAIVVRRTFQSLQRQTSDLQNGCHVDADQTAPAHPCFRDLDGEALIIETARRELLLGEDIDDVLTDRNFNSIRIQIEKSVSAEWSRLIRHQESWALACNQMWTDDDD